MYCKRRIFFCSPYPRLGRSRAWSSHRSGVSERRGSAQYQSVPGLKSFIQTKRWLFDGKYLKTDRNTCYLEHILIDLAKFFCSCRVMIDGGCERSAELLVILVICF